MNEETIQTKAYSIYISKKGETDLHWLVSFAEEGICKWFMENVFVPYVKQKFAITKQIVVNDTYVVKEETLCQKNLNLSPEDKYS